MKKESNAQEVNQNPANTQIAIHRIYNKNHGFEIKGLPTQLKDSTWDPTLNLQANPRFTALESDQYEVVVALQITGQQSEDISFQVYLEQAGLFTLKNISAEQRETVLYGVCPNVMFPYVGVTLNQILANAGFPPVYLAPLDFIKLYQQHQKDQQEKQTKETAATAVETV